MRRRLSYANVMATIAVFIALGGASYAALKLPKNSVGTKQLRKNAVTKAKLQKNSVVTAKIKGNAVTGAKVNESTLGMVPTANTANTANTATNATNATNADKVDGLDIGCPSGTVLVAGTCFETTRRAAAPSVYAALQDCAEDGRYLATPSELAALSAVIPLGANAEYTSSIYAIEDISVAGGLEVISISSGDEGVGFSADSVIDDRPYRCALGPVG